MAEKSQKQLAKETGCSQSLISLFETGKVFPGKSLKDAIAKALNKTEDEVFPGENSWPQEINEKRKDWIKQIGYC